MCANIVITNLYIATACYSTCEKVTSCKINNTQDCVCLNNQIPFWVWAHNALRKRTSNAGAEKTLFGILKFHKMESAIQHKV